MKLKIYQAIAFSMMLGMGTSSCSDWFDVIPRTSVYEEDLYKNEIGYQQVLTGLYLAMGDNNLYGREASFGLTDVVSGMFYIPKTSNRAYKFAMQYNFEYSDTKSVATGIWTKAYSVIANANELLRNAGIRQEIDVENTQNLPLPEAFRSEQTRNIICGEALAVRAYLHLDLLRLFGVNPQVNASKPSIPYVTTLKKDVTRQYTTSEAVEAVITDLLQAEAMLRESDPVVKGNPQPEDDYYKPVNRPVHINYYAVCGLLARAYQYAGKDAEAERWAKKVIGSHVFTWTKTADLNKGDYVGTSELVFNLFVRDMKERMTPYFRFNNESDNSSLLMPLSETYYRELYTGGDKRAKGFLSYQGSYLPQKYVVTEDGVADTLSIQHRIPMVRLSEMYYIASESRLAANDITGASDLLNNVRKAKGLKNADFATADAVREEIDNEYRREFVAEGQLFYYIKRRNLPDRIETQYKVDFVFPLPDNEYTYGNRQPNK